MKLWTLLWFTSMWSTCSSHDPVDCKELDQEEDVSGHHSDQYLQCKLGQVDLTDLRWSPSPSFSYKREKRDHDHTQSITITVKNHLAEGLKEVIDQYLKETQDQLPAVPLTSHLDYIDYYHYEEEFLEAKLLSRYSSSGVNRITWGKELMRLVVAFHFYRLMLRN